MDHCLLRSIDPFSQLPYLNAVNFPFSKPPQAFLDEPALAPLPIWWKRIVRRGTPSVIVSDSVCPTSPIAVLASATLMPSLSFSFDQSSLPAVCGAVNTGGVCSSGPRSTGVNPVEHAWRVNVV